MQQILLFGAGKSSTVLIEYLLINAVAEQWHLTIVDADLENIQEKMGNSSFGTAIAFDITNNEQRNTYIKNADIVISLLPPHLHYLIALDCIACKKNLLTASYIDDNILALKDSIEKNGLLFLCEMGLDPGIDHMSAKKMIDDIQAAGGQIQNFMSHCGGLVAPESDDNPWHYKISWNPRNVVMAGKAGAVYKKNGEVIKLDYSKLFNDKRFVLLNDEVFCWYPNRDSIGYIKTYGLEDCNTFIRTTLRHPDFIYGWKNVIDLHLTDEDFIYNTDNKSLSVFFKEHFENNGLNHWVEEKLKEQFSSSKSLLNELVHLLKLEEEARDSGVEKIDEFMMVSENGDLHNIAIDDLKTNAAITLADKMHDANLTLKQLFFLGIADDDTIINKGKCTAADVLQLMLEKKLPMLPADKDMVVMMHEINYSIGEKKYKSTSTLRIIGDDARHTAMAKTVGLPLAIAAKLILNGTINLKGLHIPTGKEIYDPVLQQLAQNGIVFTEDTQVENEEL